MRGKLFCGSSSHQATPRGTELLALDSVVWPNPFQSRRARLAKTSYRVYLVSFKESCCEHPSRNGQEQQWQKWSMGWFEESLVIWHICSTASSVSVSEAKQGWRGLCLK